MRIGKEFYPLKLLLTDYIDINTHFKYLERYDGCLCCVFPSKKIAKAQTAQHDGAWHVLIKSLRLGLYFFHLNLSVRLKVCVPVCGCGRRLLILISVCPVVCNVPEFIWMSWLAEIEMCERVTAGPAAQTFPTNYDECISNGVSHRHICWPCLVVYGYPGQRGHSIVSRLKVHYG